MPLTDDPSIPIEATLLRVLVAPGWVTNKGGTRRPSSIAFFEAQGEVSFFVDGPGVVAELRRIFGGVEIASVPAAALRNVGVAVERRPEECPPDFRCDANSHVVAGPAIAMEEREYERRARSVAKQPGVSLLPPV